MKNKVAPFRWNTRNIIPNETSNTIYSSRFIALHEGSITQELELHNRIIEPTKYGTSWTLNPNNDRIVIPRNTESCKPVASNTGSPII